MKYKFVGDGACVPGLPLDITAEEVSQFNVEERQAFDAALTSGAYVEIGEEPKPARAPKSKKSESVSDEGAQP
jgi:hypothetical protein